MVRPFDSFSEVFKMLAWTGYYKLLKKPKSRFKIFCYRVHRVIAFLVSMMFSLQHLIFIIQRRDSMNDMFDSLVLEIPQFNLLVKYLTLNLKTEKIDKINELLNDPIFAAKNEVDEELLTKNTKNMHRLCRILNISITVGGVLWPLTYIVRRYQDDSAVVPSYVPFETSTWTGFSWSVAMEVIPLWWVGYGHVAMDGLVATYYAQAEVQLKIIKHNLERLFNDAVPYEDIRCCQYRDVLDENFKARFVHYVQRYEKLAWYTHEVENVFSTFMSFQFFLSAVPTCMAIYKMSETTVLSVPFVFFVVVMVVLFTQVFLYCYYGNRVQYESESVNSSIYLSDWLSTSPRFRRLLLIAMERWSRGITPTVAGVIPLSLASFITIVRSAYSLYAVFSTRKE